MVFLFRVGFDLKDNFDLDSDVPWEGISPDCAPGADARGPEHFPKKLAISVDSLGVLVEIVRAVDPSEGFDNPLDPVQRAEFGLYGSQDGKPDLASGGLPLLKVHILAKPPGDVLAVRQVRSMAGNIGEVVDDHAGVIDASAGGRRREFETEFLDFGFCAHGDYGNEWT